MSRHTQKGGHLPLKTGFARIAVVVKKANVINVGRQWFIFINDFFHVLFLWLIENRLPVFSDRSGQTHRSEIVQTVQGIISLTTARPTPTIHIPKKIIYLHGGNRVFRINGGLFNA
ncbi:hypothetical protein L3033_000647 [Providencia stuartii]|nr:hypothetical protein [Escherichia coli]EKU7864140.1 hypothetical protein [Proteus mirabilis]HEM6853659.1 hypothetical protein [Providencia stuartii]EKU7878711.1 hypothetical protein [Proteus mirabilis]EKW0394032.1 hypothetical protein [Proteus mirabilis]